MDIGIKTAGELRELISNLEDDYSTEFRVRPLLSEDELKNQLYPYPYNTVTFEGIIRFYHFVYLYLFFHSLCGTICAVVKILYETSGQIF